MPLWRSMEKQLQVWAENQGTFSVKSTCNSHVSDHLWRSGPRSGSMFVVEHFFVCEAEGVWGGGGCYCINLTPDSSPGCPV